VNDDIKSLLMNRWNSLLLSFYFLPPTALPFIVVVSQEEEGRDHATTHVHAHIRNDQDTMTLKKKNCWHHLNLNLLIFLLLAASCHHSGDCIAIVVPSAAKLVGLLSMEPSTGTSPAFESKVINVTSSQVFHQHHDNAAADDDFASDEQSHPLLMSEWAYYTSGVYLVLITFTGLIMN
jgi:hypothetical protein